MGDGYTVNSKEENSRLLSQLHSIVLPLDFYPDAGYRFFSMPYRGSWIRDPSKTKKSGNKNLLFSFFCSHSAQNCNYFSLNRNR
jgi:hypothetical protein